MKTKYLLTFLAVAFTTSQTFGHGDVAPQPVNTDALPDVGEEWREENPYRAETAGEEVLISDMALTEASSDVLFQNPYQARLANPRLATEQHRVA